MSLDTLDPTVIAALRALTHAGEPDVVREVLLLFIADAPGRLTAIAAAAAEGDADRLWRAAHALKGAAGSIGATSLQNVCRDLEAIGRDGTTAAAGARIDQMRQEFARVTAAIDQLL